jgi:hypothetical protein
MISASKTFLIFAIVFLVFYFIDYNKNIDLLSWNNKAGVMIMIGMLLLIMYLSVVGLETYSNLASWLLTIYLSKILCDSV